MRLADACGDDFQLTFANADNFSVLCSQSWKKVMERVDVSKIAERRAYSLQKKDSGCYNVEIDELAIESDYRIIHIVGGRTIKVSTLVNTNDSDYDKLIEIAAEFAKMGRDVTLTPKMSRFHKFEYERFYGSLMGTKYEGKCPDFLIDGMWYEHEGFITTNPKNAFKNMLHDGLEQSSRLVIDRPNLTDAYMKRIIWQRIRNGETIDEVWIKEGENIRRIY